MRMKKNITKRKRFLNSHYKRNLSLLFSIFFLELTWLCAQKQDSIFFEDTKTLKAVGQLQHNIKVGNWIYFYPTGTIKSKGAFREGVKHGIWNYFLPTSQPSHSVEYSKGNFVRQQSFLHKNGSFELQPKPIDSLGH